jgi:hypothetical protein
MHVPLAGAADVLMVLRVDAQRRGFPVAANNPAVVRGCLVAQRSDGRAHRPLLLCRACALSRACSQRCWWSGAALPSVSAWCPPPPHTRPSQSEPRARAHPRERTRTLAHQGILVSRLAQGCQPLKGPLAAGLRLQDCIRVTAPGGAPVELDVAAGKVRQGRHLAAAPRSVAGIMHTWRRRAPHRTHASTLAPRARACARTHRTCPQQNSCSAAQAPSWKRTTRGASTASCARTHASCGAAGARQRGAVCVRRPAACAALCCVVLHPRTCTPPPPRGLQQEGAWRPPAAHANCVACGAGAC